MMSREKLLSEIRSDMKLSRAFFMKIYGYEITYPGFAEIALSRLEGIGCGKARAYYKQFVDEYEATREEALKETATWYHKQLEEKWKGERQASGDRRKEYRFAGFPQDW